jgi:predicted O-methyltransferase YrrM
LIFVPIKGADLKFGEVYALVKGIPFINRRNAEALYNLIVEAKLRNCLELGFAHGTASCYIAAAIDELGGGELVSVDIESGREWQKPSIEELLSRVSLEQYVKVYREKTGYNWYLQNIIARQSENENKICEPIFDLCIIDGPKNWTIDSSAFFLVDKLLKPGGWIIFDDYNWSYGQADHSRAATDGIIHRELSESEREVPHIRQIFHLLVMQHPNYGNFRIQEDSDWAWAQKTNSPLEPKRVSYELYTSRDYLSILAHKLRLFLRR